MTEWLNELIKSLVSSILAVAPWVGVFFWWIQRYINKKLVEAETRAIKEEQYKQARLKLEEQFQLAVSDCLFWVVQVLEDSHTTDLPRSMKQLDSALKQLKEIEAQRKSLDQDILVKLRTDIITK